MKGLGAGPCKNLVMSCWITSLSGNLRERKNSEAGLSRFLQASAKSCPASSAAGSRAAWLRHITHVSTRTERSKCRGRQLEEGDATRFSARMP